MPSVRVLRSLHKQLQLFLAQVDEGRDVFGRVKRERGRCQRKYQGETDMAASSMMMTTKRRLRLGYDRW